MTGLSFWLCLLGAFLAGQVSVIGARYVIDRAKALNFDHANYD